MRTIADKELLSTRFMLLSFAATIVLMVTIIISINSYGETAWEAPRQVGIIFSGSKDEPGRNRSHYEGLKSACEKFGYDLTVCENIAPAATLKAVRELIESGAQTIFFLETEQTTDINDIMEEYPHVRFFLVGLYSLEKSKIREYSVRDYEPQYLAGMLAGLRTRTGNVGYVAPYSSSGVNRSVNAYALGVKKTNPNAKILLSFTGSSSNRVREEQSVQMLKAAKVDVLGFHQDDSATAYAAERAGIYFISMHELYKDCGRSLGAVKINWAKAYANMLKSDTFLNEQISAWPGMVEQMIDLELTKSKLTSRELAVLESERAQLKKAKAIFCGEIHDRIGVKRCSEGEALSGKQIRSGMGWLIQGVTMVDN